MHWQTALRAERHEVESQMLILTEDKTFAINKTCIQSMGVTFDSEENAYYVTVFMTDGNDTHMAGPFGTQEDAVYSLAEFVELINEDEPW